MYGFFPQRSDGPPCWHHTWQVLASPPSLAVGYWRGGLSETLLAPVPLSATMRTGVYLERHIRFTGDTLELLDQRVLPRQETTVVCRNAADTAVAIRDMVVRGAPAIGITAAYGLALEAQRGGDIAQAVQTLLASRPTAVNLRWAVERMQNTPQDSWTAEAVEIHREDIEINRAMGRVGAALLPPNATVMTHCNAGALATGGWGTALGVIRSGVESNGIKRVFACETRPYLQGARLTAWELDEDNIPVTLITDNAAAAVLATGRIDAVVVGTDRVAANGDTANKIGTLGLAILARHYNVPFYVAMPMSTLDPRCPDGTGIPIEQRSADEVRGHGGVSWAADVEIENPAFDVTPAALVTHWVTERGLWSPDGI